jgi:hypothetical protein
VSVTLGISNARSRSGSANYYTRRQGLFFFLSVTGTAHRVDGDKGCRVPASTSIFIL